MREYLVFGETLNFNPEHAFDPFLWHGEEWGDNPVNVSVKLTNK